MTGVPMRREEDAERLRETVHAKKEAEIKGMLPQAKEHQGLVFLATTRDEEKGVE